MTKTLSLPYLLGLLEDVVARVIVRTDANARRRKAEAINVVSLNVESVIVSKEHKPQRRRT